jgi:anti-sigma B factor antagonist
MFHINNKIAGCAIVAYSPDSKKLTVLNVDKVKAKLNDLVDQGYQTLILDFKDINFIDSSGLGILIAIYNHANNRDCRFIICNLSNEVVHLLKLTRLDQVLEIFDNVDSAVKALN